MADKTIDINALGQAIDTSWGRSSTPQTASFSVKISLNGGDRLLASYQAVVNFGTQQELATMKRRYADESDRVIEAVMKRVKSTYKDLAGKTLSAKEVSSDDTLEITGVTFHNPKRTALFRRKVVFQIG